MMKGIYLLLGSNQGDRMKSLELAAGHISRKVGLPVRSSSVYRTAAWGKERQRDFYNQVMEVDSGLSPHQILDEIEEIMRSMGRIRKTKWGERIIDIDILYYGDFRINHPDLVIPHPRIAERRFTLVPLCELVPDMMHPVRGVTHLELLKQCKDQLKVTRI